MERQFTFDNVRHERAHHRRCPRQFLDCGTAAGSQTITVVNPTPGGGASNSMSFAIPCPIPLPTAAAGQTTALLGAYYFDGWSGRLTNFLFQGLPLGPYQDRQPFSAW